MLSSSTTERKLEMRKTYKPEEVKVTLKSESGEKTVVKPSKDDVYSTNGWVGRFQEKKGDEK